MPSRFLGKGPAFPDTEEISKAARWATLARVPPCQAKPSLKPYKPL